MCSTQLSLSAAYGSTFAARLAGTQPAMMPAISITTGTAIHIVKTVRPQLLQFDLKVAGAQAGEQHAWEQADEHHVNRVIDHELRDLRARGAQRKAQARTRGYGG